MIPAVIIWQIIIACVYMTITDPTSWFTYTLAVFQQGASMMIIVVMQGYIAKRTPKMIRGIITALCGIFGSFGSIPSLALQAIFEKEFGPYMIWGVIAGLDSLMLIFVLIMIFLGYYGGPPHINDGASDQEEQRGLDEGKGGYDDIPELEGYGNVHQEHIMEASARDEEDT